ncbi:MAG TPA: DUF86 domain-containing protein [Thermoanaerobaculia bacterium]|nr:DUF86 domain-containing protein [Thermoanaerobaculia bacterium]
MSGESLAYLTQQLRLVEEYLRRARAIASLSLSEYLGDPNLGDASVRQLTVLFETCHNVGKHILSRRGWREPLNKAETFEILAEQGVFPPSLVDALREAARFRNLVTYQTAAVDETKVYEILQNHLGDFDSFLTHVAGWLSAHPAP